MEIIKEDEKKSLVFLGSQVLPEIFSKWLANHRLKGTQTVYSGTLKEFVRFCSEKKFRFHHPADIKPAHIIKYREWLQEKEHSNKTINRKISALSSLFKELRYEQIIPINPVESVKRPPQDIKKIRTTFSDSEIKKMLNLYDEKTAQGLQNKIVLTLLAYTGQRISTVLALKVKDVQHVDGMTVLSLKIKGGKLRHLPIGYEPARLLSKLLKEKTSPEDFLFTPKTGKLKGKNKPITSVAVFYLIKKSLVRAGISGKKSAHSFRRAVLTKLLNTDGVSAETIRDSVSFHSSLDTLTLYKTHSESKMTENPILGIVYSK